MKMTVELPDALFRQAKIRAVERGETMREFVMAALGRELASNRTGEEARPYFVDRPLSPAFEKLAAEGRLRGGTDSTDALSEERDAH